MVQSVVIDPGHGGAQRRGSSSPDGERLDNGVVEKHINFALAQRVARHLGGASLTRGEHENRSLGERIQQARRFGARAFVSIHTTGQAQGGGEVWVHNRSNPASRQLAETIRAQLAPSFGGPGAVRVDRAELAVLSPDHHAPDTAACLVELPYYGGRGLGSGPGVDAAAAAIASGVNRFLGGGGMGMGPGMPMGRGQSDDDPQNVQRNSNRTFIEIVEDNTGAVAPSTTGQDYARGLDNPVDTIVNVAKAAWDVMKDNRPVSNVTADFATAIPQGASIADLTGWAQEPRRMRLHYHSENPLGFNSTDIYLNIGWYYNGAYQGAGQYINAATVLATGDVAWGNTVNITCSINSPMNYGTREQPIAVLPIRIRLVESNIIQNDSYAYDGVLQGNGAGRIAQI